MRSTIEFTDKHQLESKGRTLEAAFIESNSTKALVLVYRVDLTGSQLKAPPPVVKFSKREHAIPNPEAICIQLATPEHYRKTEDNEGNTGIRDEKEAQYVKQMDLETFLDKQKSSIPSGVVVQGSVKITFAVDDFWMFCTSVKPPTDWELQKIWKEFPQYDCATTIASPSEFAKELGAAFAGYSQWSDVSLSPRDELARQLRPPEIGDKVVWVHHGPVVYPRDSAKVIEALPEKSRAEVAPFVKREGYSGQSEYRFTVSVNGAPKKPVFDLPISGELRQLAEIKK